MIFVWWILDGYERRLYILIFCFDVLYILSVYCPSKWTSKTTIIYAFSLAIAILYDHHCSYLLFGIDDFSGKFQPNEFSANQNRTIFFSHSTTFRVNWLTSFCMTKWIDGTMQICHHRYGIWILFNIFIWFL